ncbi:MAG TPA: winged helix-turn-helix domain-containing protein [Acidimicrobiia bacterium]|nr:winged helix-turn-helix domain-containing protein [Acidimicrobiia bacterium]
MPTKDDPLARKSITDPREGVLVLDADQAKLLADRTRNDIIVLLAERPASTQQIAEAMGRPKGSVGYHLKLLEEAGIIEVVHTEQVRAITEKYYGRVATTYVFPHVGEEGPGHDFILEALEEMRPLKDHEDGFFTLRHARIDEGRVTEFAEEVLAIAERFAVEPRSGTTVYGLLLGMYPTDRPSLRPNDAPKERE